MDDGNTRLVLVRHGESVSTVTSRIGGHRTCRGLSDLGRRQALALRARWEDHPLVADVLYTSNFRRAQETAELITPALSGVPVVEDADLGEHDPGPDCDGLTFGEFTARFGERDWEDPYAESFPGGETLAAFHYRVGRALHRLVATHRGRTAVIVCHGGVVDAAFRTLLRLPISGSFQLHTLNTAITEFEFVPPWGGGTPRWQLDRYNDSAHLAGLPANTPRREQ